METDVETTVGEIHTSRKHCLNDIQNKPGFARLQVISDSCYCPSCMSCPGNKFRDTSPQRVQHYVQHLTDQNGFLLPKKIKRQSLEESARFKDVHVENARMVASFILDKPITAFVASNFSANLTKATINYGYDISIDGIIDARISVDFSLNFKIHWIPDVTYKWLSRQNHKWPPKEMLHDQLKYSYVIAKPSCAEKNNDNSIEFRYSFAQIERRIFSLMSDTQRLIYFIFKTMFYNWIIPINDEMVTSYIAKTTMLWMAEEYPPQHVLWKQDSINIFNTVQILFQRLSLYCQQHYLPYFFVSQINVFDCMSHQTIIYMRNEAENISKNITQYFPNNIEDVKFIGEQAVNLMKRFEPMIDDGSVIFVLDNLFNVFSEYKNRKIRSYYEAENGIG